MNPIDALFHDLRCRGRKAFIPFLTAGDPDLDTTARLVHELAGRGASLIEIGFPYSDPIADGSVIQASYTRALARGICVDEILEMVRSLQKSETFRARQVPLVGMISYTLVHRRGPETFVTQAREAGLSGAIVPDLPFEEANHLVELANRHDFKIIQLVTPTTPRERARQIAARSTGFLYCVSVVGITGERAQMPPDLLDGLRWLRTQTTLPLCVGFGVSTPEHVTMLRDVADGIIVGSALVRRLAEKQPTDALVRALGDQAQALADALNPTPV